MVRITVYVSSEKAGVGGSTPSLATMFSIICTYRISLLGCNSFVNLQVLVQVGGSKCFRWLSSRTTLMEQLLKPRNG